jgi:hypothetical protein
MKESVILHFKNRSTAYTIHIYLYIYIVDEWGHFISSLKLYSFGKEVELQEYAVGRAVLIMRERDETRLDPVNKTGSSK